MLREFCKNRLPLFFSSFTLLSNISCVKTMTSNSNKTTNWAATVEFNTVPNRPFGACMGLWIRESYDKVFFKVGYYNYTPNYCEDKRITNIIFTVNTSTFINDNSGNCVGHNLFSNVSLKTLEHQAYNHLDHPFASPHVVYVNKFELPQDNYQNRMMPMCLFARGNVVVQGDEAGAFFSVPVGVSYFPG
jgi:hypothetical protein